MKTDIQGIMSINLITTKLNVPLSEAYAVMRSNNIRHLSVVNRREEVVGIISDRDFQRAKNSESPEVFDFGYATTVRDFMNSPVQSVPFETELRVVIGKMIDEKISALLITAEDNVIGIISHHDLLKVLELQLESISKKTIEKISIWVASTPIGEIFRSIAGVGI